MENDLDKIADDNLDNVKVLREFYDEFEPLVKTAFQDMEKKAPKTTGEMCPDCGSELVIRRGKYGEFTACSNYPECKYIKRKQKRLLQFVNVQNVMEKSLKRKLVVVKSSMDVITIQNVIQHFGINQLVKFVLTVAVCLSRRKVKLNVPHVNMLNKAILKLLFSW